MLAIELTRLYARLRKRDYTGGDKKTNAGRDRKISLASSLNEKKGAAINPSSQRMAFQPPFGYADGMPRE